MKSNGLNVYVTIIGTSCFGNIERLAKAGYRIYANEYSVKELLERGISCEYLDCDNRLWERLPKISFIITNFGDYPDSCPEGLNNLSAKASFLFLAIQHGTIIFTDSVSLDQMMETFCKPELFGMKYFGMKPSKIHSITMDAITDILGHFEEFLAIYQPVSDLPAELDAKMN